MTNTVRTTAQLLTIFRDAKPGKINAQDMRDFVLSCNIDELEAILSGGSLEPERVLVTDEDGALSVSDITVGELESLSNIESNIQDQIDNISLTPGPQGPQGVAGADSTVPGPQGPQGVAGADSAVPGPQGPQGNNGADSMVAGPQGPQGFQGNNGADSVIAGPQGPQGFAGADSTVPGPQGPQGFAGVDSTVPGPQGPQGNNGADSIVPGPQGPQGDVGSQGPQGNNGADSMMAGPQGPQGDVGSQGPQGNNGTDSTVPGPQGPQGDIGSQGPQGNNGNDSTNPGPQGPQGDQGAPGAKEAIVLMSGQSKDAHAVALACVEAPDVRFEDTIIVPVGADCVSIDPIFVSVCEENSIEVIGWSSSIAGMRPGFAVEGDCVNIQYDSGLRGRLVLKLSGLRKGMGQVRFTRKSEHQMRKNIFFWNQAH